MTALARGGGQLAKHSEATGKIPELWLYDEGVTGLFVKIRAWETRMNRRGSLCLSWMPLELLVPNRCEDQR